MKNNLKKVYHSLLKEGTVSIEDENYFYDINFVEDNIDFNKVKFIDKATNQELTPTLRNKIPLNTDKMDKLSHGIILGGISNDLINFWETKIRETLSVDDLKRIGQFYMRIIKDALVNIYVSDNKLYGKIREIDFNKNSDYTTFKDILKRKLVSLKTLTPDYLEKFIVIDNNNNTVFNNTVVDFYYEKLTSDVDVFNKYLDNIRFKDAIKKFYERFFSDNRTWGDDKIPMPILVTVAQYYISQSARALSVFLNNRKNNVNTIPIRKPVRNLNDIRSTLDLINGNDAVKSISEDFSPGYRKGRGEFLFHIVFNTSNACLNIEPDAVVNNMKISIKSSMSGDCRTGESKNIVLNNKIKELVSFCKKEDITGDITSLSETELDSYIVNIKSCTELAPFNVLLGKLNAIDFDVAFKEIKNEILFEHDAIAIVHHKIDNTFELIDKAESILRNKIVYTSITGYNKSRWSFNLTDSKQSGFNDKFESLFKELQSKYKELSMNTPTAQNSHVIRTKSLLEVYSNLYILKKKIIEGALGGHMMHPYEALDMTPDQLANRIKQYGVPQKLIEKVDGQNLFFTVSDDGTLLFARNKEDMTHEDLVEKFTGHPAEKPFIEGGNAIKSGVESLLRKVDHDEVIRLFHPSEGVRTFVNFEIMHPNKPNQIVYDEKYIVFHGIVDYRNGREEVNRSNQDQRIQELVSLMSDGVSSAGFVLASNREVDLNNLTDVQIAEYVNKIYEISSALGIESSETLGEGIINVIRNEINSVGVFLSDEALSIFSDYVIKGEDSDGRVIASKEWTKFLSKEDVVKLRKLGLTSAEKVRSKIGQILQPFKGLFVELGIDLLKGVKSSYMSDEMNSENILSIRDKLQTAITDLENYMSEVPEESWPNSIKRLIPHVELIRRKGLDNIVSSAVEGGVYNSNDNLLKVTGGFAPMNQIVGAAYRDRDNIFKTFKEKFMSQESSRKSLKAVFNLIF